MRGLILGAVLSAGLAWAGTGGADLTVDADTLGSTITYDLISFVPTDCELQAADLCVRGPGARRLLRFSVFTPNIGTADLRVGVPENELDVQLCDVDGCESKWVYSACHNHYHFQTFARYELRRHGETTPILEGQKRSFCVEDTRPAGSSAPGKYCCSLDPAKCPGRVQGVSAGWGDLYPSNLPCQWIDVTDGLDPGDYDLCVLINTKGFLDEQPTDNDQACVPLHVDAPAAAVTPPKVKVLTPTPRSRARAGKPLKVTWRRKPRGELKYQEVWFSNDGGGTFSLLAAQLPLGKTSYRWAVPADAATDTARIRVIVWNRHTGAGGPSEYGRTVADSAVFHIAP